MNEAMQSPRLISLSVVGVVFGLAVFLLMRNSGDLGRANPIVEQNVGASSDSSIERMETIGPARVLPVENVSGYPLDQSNPVFKSVDDDVLKRVTPVVEARFEAGIKPLGYRRHRIVEIDVDHLQHELRRSLQAYEQDQAVEFVTIPLIEDRSIDISISKWTDGNFGVSIADGTISKANSTDLTVSFSFDSEGRTKGVINTPGTDYLIEQIGELQYYVVFEARRVDAEM